MARLLVHLWAPFLVETQQVCHGLCPSVASDSWCNTNCNHIPAQCPFWLCECKGPGPAPPPAPPTPDPEVIGYYDKTWKASGPPRGATFGVAFSGWANYESALEDSETVMSSLAGKKYLSLGGGNDNGSFDSQRLSAITDAINSGKFDAWDGLVFDVEMCSQVGLASRFADALAAAKSKNMKTLVTVSHSAPYACGDDSTLMHAIFESDDIDYISPQLYSTGSEPCPDFSETTGAGVPWSEWKGAKAALVPSIVDGTHYEMVHYYFSRAVGMEVKGYVQWAAAAAAPPIGNVSHIAFV